MTDWRKKLTEALSGDDAPTVEELVAWMKLQPPEGKAPRLLDEFAKKWSASQNGSMRKMHREERLLAEEGALVEHVQPAVEAVVEWLLANFTPDGATLYDAAGKPVLLKSIYAEIKGEEEEKDRFGLGEKTAKLCVDEFRERYAERMKAFSVGLIPK